MQKDERKEMSQERGMKQIMQDLLFDIEEFGLHVGSKKGL